MSDECFCCAQMKLSIYMIDCCLISPQGLSLFGIDVFVENGTQNHVVIDINYFPGYDGAPTFFSDLADYIHGLVHTETTEMHDTQTIFESGKLSAVAASLK